MPPATVFSTNVPAHEAGFVARHLPESGTMHRRLQDSKPPAGTRVLTLTVHDRLEPAVLEDLPELEAVVTRSDGYDHLPLAALAARNVAVYHLGDYATDAVARLALGHLMALLRRVPEADHHLRRQGWDRDPFAGRDLPSVTVGVLGAGRIGGSLARMVRALGGRVLAHDVAPDPGLDVAWADDLDDLLARSDALSLHVPLTDDTRGLLDAERIALLPPGAVLVNTARGEIIDPAAVEDALRTGHLGGFAADVLAGEPDPPDLARFRDLPNTLLTPHLGAHDDATRERRWQATAAIARAVLEGRPEDAAPYRVGWSASRST